MVAQTRTTIAPHVHPLSAKALSVLLSFPHCCVSCDYPHLIFSLEPSQSLCFSFRLHPPPIGALSHFTHQMFFPGKYKDNVNPPMTTRVPHHKLLQTSSSIKFPNVHNRANVLIVCLLSSARSVPFVSSSCVVAVSPELRSVSNHMDSYVYVRRQRGIGRSHRASCWHVSSAEPSR